MEGTGTVQFEFQRVVGIQPNGVVRRNGVVAGVPYGEGRRPKDREGVEPRTGHCHVAVV